MFLIKFGLINSCFFDYDWILLMIMINHYDVYELDYYWVLLIEYCWLWLNIIDGILLIEYFLLMLIVYSKFDFWLILIEFWICCDDVVGMTDEVVNNKEEGIVLHTARHVEIVAYHLPVNRVSW
jgi:hypothetical protein